MSWTRALFTIVLVHVDCAKRNSNAEEYKVWCDGRVRLYSVGALKETVNFAISFFSWLGWLQARIQRRAGAREGMGNFGWSWCRRGWRFGNHAVNFAPAGRSFLGCCRHLRRRSWNMMMNSCCWSYEIVTRSFLFIQYSQGIQCTWTCGRILIQTDHPKELSQNIMRPSMRKCFEQNNVTPKTNYRIFVHQKPFKLVAHEWFITTLIISTVLEGWQNSRTLFVCSSISLETRSQAWWSCVMNSGICAPYNNNDCPRIMFEVEGAESSVPGIDKETPDWLGLL